MIDGQKYFCRNWCCEWMTQNELNLWPLLSWQTDFCKSWNDTDWFNIINHLWNSVTTLYKMKLETSSTANKRHKASKDLVAEVWDHSCPPISSKSSVNRLLQLLHNHIHPSWLLHHPLWWLHAAEHYSVFNTKKQETTPLLITMTRPPGMSPKLNSHLDM